MIGVACSCREDSASASACKKAQKRRKATQATDWGQRMSWTWNWSVFVPALIVCTIFVQIMGGTMNMTNIRRYGPEADYAANPGAAILASIFAGAIYAAALTAIVGLFLHATSIQIVVCAIVLALVIYCLWGMQKMALWNRDPRQKQLVQLLIDAGMGNAAGESAALSSIKVTNFLNEHGWGQRENVKRLAHAMTVVERIAPPAVSKKADDIVWSIGQTLLGRS